MGPDAVSHATRRPGGSRTTARRWAATVAAVVAVVVAAPRPAGSLSVAAPGAATAVLGPQAASPPQRREASRPGRRSESTPATALPTAPAVAEADAPRFPLQPLDAGLQRGLQEAVGRLGLSRMATEGRLGVALVDLSDPAQARAAMINGDRMFYAASLPKIAILLAAYQAIDAGRIVPTPRLLDQIVRMIRFSDNVAATAVLSLVGFRFIASTLQTAAYRLYDPLLGGGLWIGKAYGADRYWRRDPLASMSHGATPRQTARFFVLLDRGELVSEGASTEMLQALSSPGIRHKFVRGLASRPGATIYRKSGTWRDYHADAALVVRGDSRYVAVGLVQDRHGEEILQRLIVELDELVSADRP